MRPRFLLPLLAILAIVTYLPALRQPFIEDDYSNIILSQHYGPLSGWHEMFGAPIFRLRATTWLLFYLMNRTFGIHPAGYYAVMIGFHVLNTWLVYALGAWKPIGYRVSAFAAVFFAVYEGHQEAVMWISGSTEPLLALFGLLSFLCWLRFVERRGAIWYAASLIAFVFAIFSKESAVILVALLALPVALERRWRSLLFLIPFAALAAAAALSIFLRSDSFRFQDGSFSLHAPFWMTLPFNFARLLWVWGLVALFAIVIWKPPQFRRVVTIGFAWMALSLIPYSFLTYSSRIPSRQIYLASIALSIIVGFALAACKDRFPSRPWLVSAVCAVILAHNIGYIWTKKRIQFLERAAPTEQLLAFAKSTSGPIFIQCFPRGPLVVRSSIDLMIPNGSSRELLWTAEEAARHPGVATFCYSPRNAIAGSTADAR
jgi:hypothetical protein